MKSLILSIFIFLSYVLTAQKIDSTLIKPDYGKKYVSVSLVIDSLISKDNQKLTKNPFQYFTFKFSKNVIFYNTKKQSLIGNFNSFDIQNDTLKIVMVEDNKDTLNIEVFCNKSGSYSIIITENTISGETKVYYSDKCILTRYSV